jgi:tetratricopeptide (TPR) repeat protein
MPNASSCHPSTAGTPRAPSTAGTPPTRRGWSFWIFIACLSTLSRPALAEQNETAESDADVTLAEQKAAQAFEAYQGKRFAEAVALYIEAHDVAPNADILYNVARIYDTKLGDRPLAINFYRRYIADPGAVRDRIQIANERLSALREAELAATQPAPSSESNEPAATMHVVSLRSDEPAPEPGWNGAEVTGVIMGVVGIAAVGVGAGFGLSAMAETSTVRDLCEGNLCSDQRGIDAAATAKDHALVSTIGFASGGALLALGATFYFWLGDEPSERGKQSADGRLQLGARQDRDGWSIELGGSW